jgi:fumarate reductase subunit D
MEQDFDEYFVREKSNMDKVLDLLVFIAVFVVTIFLILEIVQPAGIFDSEKISSIYLYVEIGVLIVFVIDLVRLWKQSPDTKHFFKTGWLDILATIPFGLIGPLSTIKGFGLLKWARVAGRLTKFSRASKITKEFKAASHLKKEGEEYKKKHRL